MLRAIRQLALKQMWCAPMQDNHAIITPLKISNVGGSRESVNFAWETTYLPSSTGNYAVYNLGQTNPERLGLPTIANQWVNVAQHCSDINTMIDIYNVDGVMIPRGHCYLYMTDNRNYLLAILNSGLPFDVDTHAIYYRVYQNYYYRFGGYQGGQGITVESGLLSTTESISTYVNKLAAYKNLGTHKVRAFRNGRLVNSFTLSNLRLGDHVEIVFDDSIIEQVDLPLTQLSTFTSQLDQTQKYLLYLDKEETQILRFMDDVEVYVVDTRNGIDGVYYHPNQVDSLRQLTHRCYSIPVDKLEAYIQDNPQWPTRDTLAVRLYIRGSYPDKTLTYERNRVLELYKLSDNQIKAAMLNINATIERWQAANLESSAYIKAVSTFDYVDFLNTDFLHLYGYHGLGKLLNDNPISTTGDVTELPLAAQFNSTVFEYDEDGYLLGYYPHNAGITYVRQHSDTTWLETVCAITTPTGGLLVDTPSLTIEPDLDYRFYVALVNDAGEAIEDYVDVTGDDTYYRIDDSGRVQWYIDTQLYEGVVMVDGQMAVYNFDYTLTDGVIDFSLLYMNQAGRQPPISHRHIDVFMNGKRLIPTIDYKIDFPRIVVFNKAHLVAGAQSFVVRSLGLPDTPMSPTLTQEIGFVNNGMVSVDSQYNLRDDRVIHAIIGGRLVDDSQLSYHENPTQASVDAPNGQPYMIVPAYVPRRGLVGYNAYSELEQAKVIDEQISSYMSGLYPPIVPEVNPIEQQYDLYSPFIQKLIHECRQGNIVAPSTGLANNKVTQLVSHFIDLLDFDPARDDALDTNYVAIHPHPYSETVEVTVDEYRLIEKAITIYLDDKVDLTQFVTIAVN